MSFKDRLQTATILFAGVSFFYFTELLFEILAFVHLLSVLEVLGQISQVSLTVQKKLLTLLCYTISVAPLTCSILCRPTDALLWTSVVINTANDALQFLCGRYCPNWILSSRKIGAISPQKTYRGYFLGTLICALIFQELLSLEFFFLLTTLGLSSLGDLFMSGLKRHLRIKRYSTILGSHGGITDRADSFMFSTPFLIFSSPR